MGVINCAYAPTWALVSGVIAYRYQPRVATPHLPPSGGWVGWGKTSHRRAQVFDLKAQIMISFLPPLYLSPLTLTNVTVQARMRP